MNENPPTPVKHAPGDRQDGQPHRRPTQPQLTVAGATTPPICAIPRRFVANSRSFRDEPGLIRRAARGTMSA
jgi:hypothetical protein